MSPDGSPPARGLDVIVTDVLGRRRRDPGVAAWLRRAAPRGVGGTMGLVLASDAAMRRLNRQFAGTDHATDVLSFPSGDDRGRTPARGRERVSSARRREKWAAYLGDVVIATGVSRRQARRVRHAWPAELRTLALHGLLHLLGYDHATDAGEMARLERRLRRRAGLGEALLERTARGTTPGRRFPRKTR